MHRVQRCRCQVLAPGRQMWKDGLKTRHEHTETKHWDVTEDRSLAMTFLSSATGRRPPSEYHAIERMSWVCWMGLSCVRVTVSQKVMVFSAEYAMNFPCCGRAMRGHGARGTDHSETVDPVAASICLIILSLIRTKKCSCTRGNQTLAHCGEYLAL